MVKGFHVQEGLYFTRGENGSVTVTVTESAQVDSPILRSFDVDVDGFASVVASMSARGEEAGGFYEAREFLTRAPKEQGDARFTDVEHSKGKICPECDGHGTQLQEDSAPTTCGWCKGTGKLRPC